MLHFEPAAGPLLLIDDAEPGARDLSLAVPPGASAIVLPNPRGSYGGSTAATCTAALVALQRLSTLDDPFEWALRIDTDTLVIAPFADRVSARLRPVSDAGLAGSYKWNANGHLRDFAVWRGAIRQLRSRVRVYRKPPVSGRRIEQALTGRTAQMRTTVRLADRHGYVPGENVLAAALVLTRAFVERMASHGYVDDPLTWITTPVGDDVMLGIFARAVDLRMVDLSGGDGPVAVLQTGLADAPEALLERGFALIHSVKDDPRFSEHEVRSFFRQRRTETASAP